MTWQVFKNGIDKTSVVRPIKQFRIKGRLGSKTLTLRVTDTSGTEEWVAGDVVRVVHDTVEIFEGLIRIATKSDMGLSGVRILDVSCVDYNILLDMDVIKEAASRSVDESDKDRITWLVDTYGTKGVVAGTSVIELVASLPGGEDGLPRQDLGRQTLGAAVQAVATFAGAGGRLYVDSDKELHYFDDEALSAPFALSSSPDGGSLKKLIAFTYTEDSVDVVHRVLVEGTGVEVTREIGVLPDPDDIVEAVLTDSNITSVEQANAAGDAFLAAHGSAVEGSFQALWAGLEAGQTIQITNDLYGLVAEPFWISSVDVSLSSINDVRYDVSFGRNPPDMASLIGSTSRAIEAAGVLAAETEASLADLTVGGANLVQNSSFENADTSFWSVGSGWVFGYDPVGPEEAFDRDLTARLVLAAATAGDLVTDPIAVVRSDDYWISAWTLMRAWTSGAGVIELREYDDAAGTSLVQTTPIASVGAVEADYTRHSVHMGTNDQLGRTEFHADTIAIRVAFNSGGAVATFTWDVDAVQVERGRLITAYAPRPAELIDESVGTTQIADDAVTTAKIIANAIVAGKIAAGEITTTHFAADAVIANVLNVGGTVLIDTDGIVITDGALTFSDQFGNSVLTGAGFGASWLDFLSEGFYNGHFAAGTTDDIVAATEVGGADTEAEYLASLSTDIPYWIVQSESGAGTLKRVVDSTAVGGFALQWAGTENATIYQDIPILPGRQYSTNLNWRYTNSASEFALEIGTQFRTSSHAAIGSEVDEGFSYTTTKAVYSEEAVFTITDAAPASARYLRFIIHISRTSGSPTVWLNAARAIPSGLGVINIIGDGNGVAGLNIDSSGGGFLSLGIDSESSHRLALSGDNPATISMGAGGTRDVFLSRSGAGILTLSDDSGANSSQFSVQAASGKRSFITQLVAGDTSSRVVLSGDASSVSLQFGPGNAARDVVLYRSGTKGVSLAVDGAATPLDNVFVYSANMEFSGTRFSLPGGARIRFVEHADYAADAGDTALLYARDNGAGKTQLVVRFSSGAIQVLATQP